jgi:hypothetical protein
MTKEALTVSADTTTSAPRQLKSYRATCSSTNEHSDCPAVAVFDISYSTALEIVGLAGLVSANKLVDCRKWDYRARWLRVSHDDVCEGEDAGEETDEPADDGDDNEMRTECECLVVSRDDFYFRCHLRHQDDMITCEPQYITELAEFFGIPFVVQPIT